MLIARAPVRISFGGGGTDLAAYYERFGGMVVSASINKYFYAIVTTNDLDDLQVISADYRSHFHHPADDDLVWDGDLGLPKAVLHHFGIRRGVNVFVASEVPPGTGLGSSSAVAVGLITAMNTLLQRPTTKQELAEMASYIEIEKLGMPIGKQDQYASACGGLNIIHFGKERTTVEPLRMDRLKRFELEDRLMLFFTGTSRESTGILRHQKASSERNEGEVIQSLHEIKALAGDIREALESGNIDHFGELLHQSWQFKKKLASGISSGFIDECYDAARAAGAIGGKITGAGGGGFLMLYCPLEHQKRVTAIMREKGLKRMAFRFDYQGATVLMNMAQFDPRWVSPYEPPSLQPEELEVPVQTTEDRIDKIIVGSPLEIVTRGGAR